MSPIDPDVGDVQDPYEANAALLYDMWIDVYKKCLRIVEEYVNKWEKRLSVHEAHFSLPLPYNVIPPGPINISGIDMQVLAINAKSDGTVSFTDDVTGESFSLAASESTVDLAAAPPTWAINQRMGISDLTGGDDGNYLAVTWSVSEKSTL